MNNPRENRIGRRQLIMAFGGFVAAATVGCASEKKPGVTVSNPILNRGNGTPTNPGQNEPPTNPPAQTPAETPPQTEPGPEPQEGWKKQKSVEGWSMNLPQDFEYDDSYEDLDAARFRKFLFLNHYTYVTVRDRTTPNRPLNDYAQEAANSIPDRVGESEILGEGRNIAGKPTIAITATISGGYDLAGDRKLFAYVVRNGEKEYMVELITLKDYFAEEKQLFEQIVDTLSFTN